MVYRSLRSHQVLRWRPGSSYDDPEVECPVKQNKKQNYKNRNEEAHLVKISEKKLIYQK